MKQSQSKQKQTTRVPAKTTKLADLSGEIGAGFRSNTKVSEVMKEMSRGASATKESRSSHLDDRVLEYAEVLAHAVETFGSRMRANAWLNRPSRIFNNQSPLQVLTENPAAVEEELVRIDHGMFA